MLALVVIDCAEHTVIESLISRGELPTLSALAQHGLRVPLSSDGHSLDGSVFQTFLTGVNPGKHGIHKYQQLVPGTYDYQLSKAAASPVPQIWNVLSAQRKQCCVFDVPKAFPSPQFAGWLVASWGSYSPAGDPGSVPSGLYRELVRRFGSHPMRIQKALPLTPARYEKAIHKLQQGVRLRTDACRWLLKDHRCDFFATTYSESHVAAHQFWQLRDPQHPLYDPESAERCGDAVEKIYQEIDKQLGILLEALPAETTVVVMTQQGVQHNYSGSRFLPPWLARREGRPCKPHWLVGIDAALGSRLRNVLRQHIPERFSNSLVQRKFPSDGEIFLLPGSEYGALLRVNLQGREPAGTVPKSSYRGVIESLRDDVLQLSNPATGEPAAAEVQLTHDMYEGPCLHALPDAIVCWRNDHSIDALECPQHGLLSEGITFTDITHSMHTSAGMAIIAGAGISAGQIDTRHDIRDMTATLYHLAGADPPKHLEGNVIAAINRPALHTSHAEQPNGG